MDLEKAIGGVPAATSAGHRHGARLRTDRRSLPGGILADNLLDHQAKERLPVAPETANRLAAAEELGHGLGARELDDFAVNLLKSKVHKLRELSPLWDMFKEGIDINSIQWAAH